VPHVVREIPTKLERQRVEAALAAHDDWFYDFSFVNGASSGLEDPFIVATHMTRAELAFPALDETFAGRWHDVRCVDMACHQGWFAMQTALRGARQVYGIDVRREHIERARLVSELADLDNATFERRNLFDLDPDRDGTFDLTLFLGILYHLEDPVGALKKARALTEELCVIETQVARPAPALSYMWGPDPNPRTGSAIAVGRVDEVHAAEGGAVVLVPTLDALYDLLYAVGFANVRLAQPGPDAQEQYVAGERVILFAEV
jgi:tRNA (mo5U34)-methyltransferase